MAKDKTTFMGVFQSTPSARRATAARNALNSLSLVFQSTPSARRATMFIGNFAVTRFISIHALREESDAPVAAAAAAHNRISIHALREESDRCRCGRRWRWT